MKPFARSSSTSRRGRWTTCSEPEPEPEPGTGTGTGTGKAFAVTVQHTRSSERAWNAQVAARSDGSSFCRGTQRGRSLAPALRGEPAMSAEPVTEAVMKPKQDPIDL